MPRIRCGGSIDWVHYHIPRATLDVFTDDIEMAGVQVLECSHGTVDPVLHQLTTMILPFLNPTTPSSELFLNYFRLLFCAHVTRTYARSFGSVDSYRGGGLAPWQRRHVTELLRENTDVPIRLATLAHECGLSVSHFARSFRRSFGMSAHQYLILQRIEKSKALLSKSAYSLCEVALEAGFSDQAAFSRTFKSVVGTSPGHWRRELNHQRSHGVPTEYFRATRKKTRGQDSEQGRLEVDPARCHD